MERGVFHVGTTNGLCLCLLIDTGAEMNVAGVGYIEALELMVADSAPPTVTMTPRHLPPWATRRSVGRF